MEEKNIFHKIYQKVDQYLTVAELIFLSTITALLLIERASGFVLMHYSFYALIALAVLYYLKSIGDFTQGFDWKKFINKIPFIGPSMITLGIAFWIIGVSSLIPLFIVGIPFSIMGTIVYFKNKEIKTNEKYRFLLFSIFGLFLLYVYLK